MQVVTIFIQNNQKKLLIQKRSKSKGGKYGITSGHTLENETGKQGAIREAKEELGIDIKEQELKQIFKTKINEITYNLYYLEKEIKLQELILQQEEVEWIGWYTIKEIKQLIQNNKFYEKQVEAFKIFEKYIKRRDFNYGNNSSMGYKQRM